MKYLHNVHHLCKVAHVKWHIYFFLLLYIGGPIWWRVCYQLSRYSYSYQTIHQTTCKPKIRLHIEKTLKIKFSLGVCINTSAWDQGIISFAVWNQLVLTPLKQSNCTGLYCQANKGQWRSDLVGKLWVGGDKTSRATGRNSLQFTVPDTWFYTNCQSVKRTALSGRGDGRRSTTCPLQSLWLDSPAPSCQNNCPMEWNC